MNLIADNLFSVLLGWTRSLFNSLWNMLTNNSSGFTGFLQRFWLPIIIIILVFGTLTDYIIWLIRWRPYYAWGTWFKKRIGRRRLNQTQHFMEDLDHSPLDLPEYQMVYEGEDGAPLMDEPVYFDFQPDAQQATMDNQTDGGFRPMGPFIEQEPQFAPSLPWDAYSHPGLEPESGQQAWLSQSGYEQGAIQQETILQNQLNYFQHQEQAANPGSIADLASAESTQFPPGSARRRRAGAKRQRGKKVLQSIKDTFFMSEEAFETIDTLQSPVSQEDAFHKPFYPQNYTYKEQASGKTGNGQHE